jgi:DNA modification methylase
MADNIGTCQDDEGKVEEVIENVILHKKLNHPSLSIETTTPMSIETTFKNKVHNADCLTYLEELCKEEKQIDTIILDPPYFNVVNEKWDKQWKSMEDYLNWMENIIKKLYDVSKYNCSFWLFGFPYQLSYIIPIVEKYGFKYRQHITINKGMRSVAGRTSSKLKMFPVATEYVVFFYKDATNVVKKFLQDKQKEHNISSKDINIHLGKAINGGGTWSSIAGIRQKNIQYPTREDWNKLEELFGKFDIQYDDYIYTFNIEPKLTDVWDDINFYDKTYKKYHPTQKPYKLIERLIKCSTNEGMNVLDIFMGSCMTALVCKETNRNYFGCELNDAYFKENLISE